MKVERKVVSGAVSQLLYLGLVCIALCSCSSTCPIPKAKYEPPPPPAPECQLPHCSVDYNFPISLVTSPKIYVLKEQRRLWLIDHDTLIRDYHVGLGHSPKGDKYYRGDGRTPEGEFLICSKNASSRYHKSLGISYPSPRNAESALSCGMISYNEYCSIKQANDAVRLPPANTALGGQVMVHGGGSYDDWTLGCVALSNSAMDELFEAAKVGTPIYIMP